MHDEHDFMAAIQSNRADDAARLVYADWLDEQGEATKAEYLRSVVALGRVASAIDLNSNEAVQVCEQEAELSFQWIESVVRPYVLRLTTLERTCTIHAIKGLRDLLQLPLMDCMTVFETLPFEIVLSHSLSEAKKVSEELVAAKGLEFHVQYLDNVQDRGVRYLFPVLGPWPVALAAFDEDQEELSNTVSAVLGAEALSRYAHSRDGNRSILIRMPVTVQTLSRLEHALASRINATSRNRRPPHRYRFATSVVAPNGSQT
jgi:uncharacterized protein (TIGR02996 family)